MLQKIIQVGNSYAVTIPSSFTEEVGWKVGEQIMVTADVESETIKIQQKKSALRSGTTPEFKSWLKKFNTKHKKALTELAKK